MPAAGGLPGIEETNLQAYVVRVRAEVEWSTLAALFGGALLVVLGPLFTVYRPLPSNLLSPTLRSLHADRICTLRIYVLRQAVFLLKMYACFCWGQDDEVRKRFGLNPYPPDPGTFRQS